MERKTETQRKDLIFSRSQINLVVIDLDLELDSSEPATHFQLRSLFDETYSSFGDG